MAAVEVETGRRLVVRRRAVLVGLGLIRVPVLVVAQVLGMLTGFVPAIRRHGRPAELERQKGEQDDGEDSTHGRESSGYRVGLVASKANGLWGFTTSRRGHARRCGSSHGG